uniref:Uncharacterized protein n=1 Tax=Oryza rufipogon TaxID=4529 RepID=A0A0E0RDQ8_ORYRU
MAGVLPSSAVPGVEAARRRAAVVAAVRVAKRHGGGVPGAAAVPRRCERERPGLGGWATDAAVVARWGAAAGQWERRRVAPEPKRQCFRRRRRPRWLC